MDARLAAGLFVVGVPAACALIFFAGILLSLIRGPRGSTTLRQRIAAAYERGGWARVVITLAVVLVFLAGAAPIWLFAPDALVTPAFFVWLFSVALASSWYIVL